MKTVILYIFKKDEDRKTITHVMKEFLTEWLGVDGYSMVVGAEE